MTIHKSKLLSEFSSLPDPDFIFECYQSILLREADPSGLSHYLARVVAGEDRLSLAAEIASSAEAQALPSTRKRVVGKILAMHAAAMAAEAWTPARRRKLAERLNRYFLVLSEPISSNGTPVDSSDPFSDYLQSVIQTGVPSIADIR